jgi:DUF1707 SHOCT-like domain
MNNRTSSERWRDWAGDWTGSWAGVRPPSGLRIGDAEREAAVAALGEHYAAGRLTKEEYDERSAIAWSARTGSDLAPLFNDLPRATARPPAPKPPQRRPDRRVHIPFLPVLLVVIGLAILTHSPWLVLLVVGVMWWAGMFRWGRRHGCNGRTGGS